MKKIISAFLASVMVIAAISSLSIATAAGTKTIAADKTAQWTYQESSEGYDLRIHGWAEWETAAYMGFSLSDFTTENLTGASLVLTTVSASNAGTAYIYAADYSAFTNGNQYEGSGNVPSYTETELSSFSSPVSAGEFEIDITSYMLSLAENSSDVAFRIDVKSQNTNNNWVIGSCTNSSAAPYIKLTYAGEDEGIQNGSFTSGLNGWNTLDSYASVSNGVLTLSNSESSYEEKVWQNVTGIENGTYDLTVYTTSTDVAGTCYVYAKSAGHTIASTSVPISSSQTKITVPSVIIDNGTCEIGVYVNGTTTLTADNFVFTETPETRVPFLKGGEISKLTYVEDKGASVSPKVAFHYADGTEADGLQVLAENGFNLARIRVLNNPGPGNGNGTYYLPEGYQDLEDCLNMARRAKDKGMQIELTIAYSDWWTDGGEQYPPNDWTAGASGLSGADLAAYYADKISAYTKEVMQAMIDQGTTPEYVSIGNEMQLGMCFGAYPNGNALYNNATYLAQLVKAGAEVVREMSPETKIILHTDNGGKVLTGRGTFVSLLSLVKDYYDVIGVSYYPYYNSDVSIDTLVAEFNTMIAKYDKDVIVMESGYNWSELRGDGWEGQLQDSGYYQDIYGESVEGQKAFLTELYAKLKNVSGGRCLGVLYWDPIMLYDNANYVIGWAIKESDDWTDANVVSNSNLFDFDSNALSSQEAMKYNTESSDKVLVTGTIKNGNDAVKNTLVTFTVNYEEYTVTTDAYGQYIVAVDYPWNDKIGITADGYAGSYYVDAPSDGILLSGIDFPSNSSDIIPTPTPTAAPEEITPPVITDFTLTAEAGDGVISYTAEYSVDYENSVLIVALYDGDTLKSCKIGEKTDSFEVSNESGTYTVKAFLWDNLLNLKPLAEAKEQTVEITVNN